MDRLGRLRAGEVEAYKEVYAELRPRLFAFLLRLCRSRAVAEELLQDCFVKLASHAHKLREDTVLSAWMFTVARNAAMSHRRWAAIDASRILLAWRPAPLLTPEEEAASNAGERALERALGKLSFADREIILLVAVEGMAQEEAATVLGLSHTALRQRLARARQRLAALMEVT